MDDEDIEYFEEDLIKVDKIEHCNYYYSYLIYRCDGVCFNIDLCI